ncbi:hypothetical protein GcM1_250207 [Golovinomyces cichoracearum]|uniref:Uncharacterized protein n=1 Tax=Golovinomyces cichoracearum TaxID=62708 RepID=A0A420IB80_9PEZI|nr:hypothetical protein GcM1_250207 [Golovinomyces cichoracearum]
MTPDDYKPPVQGPLRLKGIGPIGIKKKKKKKKTKDDTTKQDPDSRTDSNSVAKSYSGNGDVNDTKLLSLAESSELNQYEDKNEDRNSTKTPSERAFEVMRKKRVRNVLLLLPFFTLSLLFPFNCSSSLLNFF